MLHFCKGFYIVLHLCESEKEKIGKRETKKFLHGTFTMRRKKMHIVVETFLENLFFYIYTLVRCWEDGTRVSPVMASCYTRSI